MSERSFETSIELDAPVEVVWKAISDGTELARWFPPEAKVTPGMGGSVWLSWGSMAEFPSRIEIWEPPNRMRTAHEAERPWTGGATEGKGPWVIAVDYYVEARAGGGTTLRLVHSGFGRGPGWDDEYDSVANGWKYELRSLRHYLSRHRGTDREAFYLPQKTDLTPAQAWEAMLGPTGVIRHPDPSRLKEGVRYRVETPWGEAFEGKVLVFTPGRALAGTVAALDDALFRIEIERWEGSATPFAWLSVWGPKRTLVKEYRRRFEQAMEESLAARA